MPTFRFPSTGVEVAEQAILLAIDDVLLPLKQHLCYHITRPQVRPEPVLAPSRDNPQAPDSCAAHFYGTVLHEGNKFRMWYYPCSLGANPDWPPALQAQIKNYPDPIFQGPVCYAESDDGIRWVKPDLGQVLFKGTRHNNGIALPYALIAGATLLRDDDDPDPARRYKLIFEYFNKGDHPPLHEFWGTVACAVSPDGLHWSISNAHPIDDFVEQSSFYKFNGYYIINAHSMENWRLSEGGAPSGRQGYVWLSPDFDHWPQAAAESFMLPEPVNPAERGMNLPYDQVHLGVGAAGYGNVMVGVTCVWHNDPEFNKISGDFHLVVSNDGVAFREPVKGHLFLSGRDSPSSFQAEKPYPTVLCQANGILNVGDETRLYHGRWLNAPFTEGASGEVALATLPRDRWGALGLYDNEAEPAAYQAPTRAEEGSVWSAPITLPVSECSISLNAEGTAGISVEIADEQFNLIPEFSGQQSGRPDTPGGLDCAVRWPAAGLSALAGQTVRLHLQLQRGDHPLPMLYAVNLRCR